MSSSPVALVIQTRIADEGVSEYVAWQARVGHALQSRPGFLDQQVVAPSPPAQTDWIVIQRFETLEDARAWMQSEELRALIHEVSGYFVGHDDIFLRPDVQDKSLPVSAIISCRVAPEDVEGFLRWEDKIFLAEVKAPGFLGHKLNRPIPGIQEDWVIVVTFDTDDHLSRWLESPTREALLAEGKRYQGHVHVRKTNYGFAVWARGEEAPPSSPRWILKSNLLVLLVLYPIVYLWGYLVGTPLLGGAPAWFSLFIGNLVSTQLLGWFFVPWALKRFDAWLEPRPPLATELAGWGILLLLFGVSMAGYAWLLALPPLHYG